MDDEQKIPTQEEIDQVLAPEKTEDEQITEKLTPEERAIAAKILPMLASRANAAAELNYAKKLEKDMNELKTANEKYLKIEIENLRKSLTPPSKDDIQELLSQEYAEFPIKIGGKEPRDFVIRELPLAAEMRLVKAVKKTLGERLKEVSGIEWNTSSTTLEKIVKIMDMVPGAVDTLAECCAVCLNPFGEEPDIDAEWVMNHVNITRMIGILNAQQEASKYRDFLSHVYRLIPGMTS